MNEDIIAAILLPDNQMVNAKFPMVNDRSTIIYNQIDHFESDIVLLNSDNHGKNINQARLLGIGQGFKFR